MIDNNEKTTVLLKRIAQGLGGVREAQQVAELLARLERYEQALKHIAEHGDKESAILASYILAYETQIRVDKYELCTHNMVLTSQGCHLHPGESGYGEKK